MAQEIKSKRSGAVSANAEELYLFINKVGTGQALLTAVDCR